MKVISVENVSKKFTLSHNRPKNLADGLRSVLNGSPREDFWALKDVSFDVEQGEALGIIGHNGAGKSTMLKLLTHIMKPTSGRIRTRGRVSALIEVGAGFHPEMTGRENVYLNGSILGMSRREISKKLDDIVAFAELEKFIDTPVKRYSSGMYARLGFAVAAHVDPEMLLVDEVLSVGDERFQVKCQEHMGSLLKKGSTILFVSHNHRAVEALCNRCLVVNRGQVVFDGLPADAVRALRRCFEVQMLERSQAIDVDSRPVRVIEVRTLDVDGNEISEIPCGAPIVIEVIGEAYKEIDGLNLGVEINNAQNIICYDINSRMDDYMPCVSPGRFSMKLEIPSCKLVDGFYWITIGLMDRRESIHYDSCEKCLRFLVIDEKGYRGVARLGHSWNFSAS